MRQKTEWFDRNRLGTEPYAGWCGRTAGVTPPPTRFEFEFRLVKCLRGVRRSDVKH
jgi:hypothetical protein